MCLLFLSILLLVLQIFLFAQYDLFVYYFVTAVHSAKFPSFFFFFFSFFTYGMAPKKHHNLYRENTNIEKIYVCDNASELGKVSHVPIPILIFLSIFFLVFLNFSGMIGYACWLTCTDEIPNVYRQTSYWDCLLVPFPLWPGASIPFSDYWGGGGKS